MKQRYNILIYSCIWIVAVFILLFSMFQNLGDAKVINYSGIVRGATQKLIKQELYGEQDDELILYLDDILYDLQTGEGKYNLTKLNNQSYQDELSAMNEAWQQIKIEIQNVRNGGNQDTLYQLSEVYFKMADHMVLTAQSYSERESSRITHIFVGYLVATISGFIIWYRYKQKQLKKAMYIDELTGIHNLIGFEYSLKQKAEKINNNNALICFDIDDFKYLNSIYGSDIGDTLLKIIAWTLQNYVGENGYCARYGNDNFLFLCNYDEQTITDLKTNIQKNMEQAMKLDIYNDFTLCFGIYMIQKKDSLVIAIDNTLLAHKQAKKMGKGKILHYNEILLSQLYNENKLTKRMYSALKKQEFKLYLQPKFDIPNLNTVGAEALVRWENEDGTCLQPDEFIPFFEHNGFIYELDFYMLEQVCIFIKEHHLETSNFRISVNFSRVSIHHQDFSQRLKSILMKYKTPIQCIELEITENAINEFSSYIISMLEDLCKEGFILSMDDFGAGYSSLTSIHKLPIKVIKVDKQFLKETHQSTKMISIMKLIIEMAYLLDKEVICEGVETKEDIQLLDTLNCHLGQGFFVSKPIYQTEFAKKFLKDN